MWLLLLAFASPVIGQHLKVNESQITQCASLNNVCSVIHNRFWMSNSVEKFCTCSKGHFCPATYNRHDGFSMDINKRSQMKFCRPLTQIVKKIELCQPNEVAISVKTLFQLDSIKTQSVQWLCVCNVENNRLSKMRKVKKDIKHAKAIYWKHHSRNGENIDEENNLFEITDNYKCNGLRRCKHRDFCGFARMDLGFVYQRCSCPKFFKCGFSANDSNISEDIEELFYNGPVFRATCIPENEEDFW